MKKSTSVFRSCLLRMAPGTMEPDRDWSAEFGVTAEFLGGDEFMIILMLIL